VVGGHRRVYLAALLSCPEKVAAGPGCHVAASSLSEGSFRIFLRRASDRMSSDKAVPPRSLVVSLPRVDVLLNGFDILQCKLVPWI
jgi:hypothetical protein